MEEFRVDYGDIGKYGVKEVVRGLKEEFSFAANLDLVKDKSKLAASYEISQGLLQRLRVLRQESKTQGRKNVSGFSKTIWNFDSQIDNVYRRNLT